MSSVLFLSSNKQLCSSVEAVLTAAGHEVTTCAPADYVMNARTYDCAVVDTQPLSHELVAQLIWVGTTCVIGVYHTEAEHARQVGRGALWCIPDIVDVADELEDGPLSIKLAIGVSRMGNSGIPELDRTMSGMRELLCGFKNPKEGGMRDLFKAERAIPPRERLLGSVTPVVSQGQDRNGS